MRKTKHENILTAAAALIVGTLIPGRLTTDAELCELAKGRQMVVHFRGPGGGGEIALAVRFAYDTLNDGAEVMAPRVEMTGFAGTSSPARARAVAVLHGQVADLACAIEATICDMCVPIGAAGA